MRTVGDFIFFKMVAFFGEHFFHVNIEGLVREDALFFDVPPLGIGEQDGEFNLNLFKVFEDFSGDRARHALWFGPVFEVFLRKIRLLQILQNYFRVAHAVLGQVLIHVSFYLRYDFRQLLTLHACLQLLVLKSMI
jgi:hypothetical protein